MQVSEFNSVECNSSREMTEHWSGLFFVNRNARLTLQEIHFNEQQSKHIRHSESKTLYKWDHIDR